MISLLSVRAAAGEPLRFRTPAQCETEGGSSVRIEPGRFLPEPDWAKLEGDYKKLEDDNTRLIGENKVYIAEESVLGWKSTLAATLAGLALGAYIWKD